MTGSARKGRVSESLRLVVVLYAVFKTLLELFLGLAETSGELWNLRSAKQQGDDDTNSYNFC
jgi:hypothetical protein